ncbi:MAG: hypothetical protein R2710_16920 [Acidimicrobiales bacterium]
MIGVVVETVFVAYLVAFGRRAAALGFTGLASEALEGDRAQQALSVRSAPDGEYIDRCVVTFARQRSMTEPTDALTIRCETDADHDQIARIVAAAFGSSVELNSSIAFVHHPSTSRRWRWSPSSRARSSAT